MPDAETWMRERMAGALGLTAGPISVEGSPTLAHAYAVSALAAAAVTTTARAAAELVAALGHPEPAARISRPLADAWFGVAVAPVGWAAPSPWDPIAGDYPAADGWVRLHTNASHHRAAALRVLGVAADRDEVAAAVAAWRSEELEAAVVGEGGCAARLRSASEWAAHPAGVAAAAEPLVAIDPIEGDAAAGSGWHPAPGRPLAGLRVLDLTRVLAGPVATRLLAGLGAEVLRIDPPGWDEPALAPDLTLGKRCARLDARDPAELERLRELLAQSDVLVHGYRGGALDGLGLDAATRARLRPGLIDVSLTAYGHTGPWAQRRGFDSLVQMSTGIADPRAGEEDSAPDGAAGADDRHGPDGGSPKPTPLPVQALDHATGYLMAASALVGLARRVRFRIGMRARLSLARTAHELTSAPRFVPNDANRDSGERYGTNRGEAMALVRHPLETPWGRATVLDAPFALDGVALTWDRGPRPLGSDAPAW